MAALTPEEARRTVDQAIGAYQTLLRRGGSADDALFQATLAVTEARKALKDAPSAEAVAKLKQAIMVEAIATTQKTSQFPEKIFDRQKNTWVQEAQKLGTPASRYSQHNDAIQKGEMRADALKQGLPDPLKPGTVAGDAPLITGDDVRATLLRATEGIPDPDKREQVAKMIKEADAAELAASNVRSVEQANQFLQNLVSDAKIKLNPNAPITEAEKNEFANLLKQPFKPRAERTAAELGATIFEHGAAVDEAAAKVASHLLEGKLAGAAGKVLKVAAPLLAGIAIASQADAAELAVKNNQLPREAVAGYMALVTAGVVAGVADPSFGAASDVATHKAFQAFADKYNLSAEARNALDPSISGMLNQQLSPQQQKFLSHNAALPDKPDASYPAGVNQLIAINNQIKAITEARNQPGNGTPIDPNSPEGAAQRQQNERYAQLQAEYVKAYVAAANGDPNFLPFLDKQAGTQAQVALAAQDPKLRQEADAAFDKLPAVPGPNDSPSTRRLIEARNKLRDRMAELEKAEKTDNRPGSLTYYGQQNDKAVEQYYQAFAKEKANPDTATPAPAADAMAGVKANKKDVAKMKIDHPAIVAGNDKVEKKEPTNQDNKPVKVAAATNGRAAGPGV